MGREGQSVPGNTHICAAQDALSRRTNLLRSWRSAGASSRPQAAARIMVHVVVAGSVAELREVELNSAALGLGPIDVMPVHIPDLFE